MKAGDFILVDYTGRVKGSGEIFDTTKEEVAKSEGAYDPNSNVKYKPVTIIIDGGFTIPGLNETLKRMEVGGKKEVELQPDEAFGGRREELVKIIPLAKFREQNIDPTPGSIVTVNRLHGRVASVSGGRVKVDFNHPLAGKTLDYELEVKGKIEDDAEKVKAVVNYFTGDENAVADLDGKEVEINMKIDVPRNVKETMANVIAKWVGVEKVKFIETFGEFKDIDNANKQTDKQRVEKGADKK